MKKNNSSKDYISWKNEVEKGYFSLWRFCGFTHTVIGVGCFALCDSYWDDEKKVVVTKKDDQRKIVGHDFNFVSFGKTVEEASKYSGKELKQRMKKLPNSQLIVSISVMEPFEKQDKSAYGFAACVTGCICTGFEEKRV